MAALFMRYHNTAQYLITAIILALSLPAEAAQKRSQAVARAFQLENPCPSTGKTKGRCPGYERDHRWPICFHDGPDAVWNLQWLTIQEHREKTRLDIKVCKWDGR